MNDLLVNPAVQSGFIPLVVALICVFILKRAGWYWSGLAFAIAYFTSVYFTVGLQLTPLTSTRKTLILAIAAIVLGLVLDVVINVARQKPRVVFGALFAAGACAVIWVVWPVASRQEGAELWLTLLPSMLYAGWITAGTQTLHDKSDEGAMVALAQGLGTGISALLGASALLGQLGIAIGAIAGAYLIMLVFNQEVKLGSNFTLPIGLLNGLIGVGAVLYASLPWYTLLPLVLIPATIYIPVTSERSKFFKLLMLALLTLPLTIIAIVIAWSTTGNSEGLY
ncbi:MAG: hypothetical protein PVJ39_03125 [Gammaproteobacteria bacterium]|jgi:hypothetical protein